MDAAGAPGVIADSIFDYGAGHMSATSEVVLLCIGTDRSTGDALGPLIGTSLTGALPEGCTVLGTLDDPVHAGNLSATMESVARSFMNPLVIAVDACLGRLESVGTLTVGQGSLRPGAGVNKTLPAVGQVYVTGVVNVGGFMEYLVLQNTRLSLVVKMARVAAEGIHTGAQRLRHLGESTGALQQGLVRRQPVL